MWCLNINFMVGITSLKFMKWCQSHQAHTFFLKFCFVIEYLVGVSVENLHEHDCAPSFKL